MAKIHILYMNKVSMRLLVEILSETIKDRCETDLKWFFDIYIQT